MTTPTANSAEGIDLSLLEFWEQPLDRRHADFAKLRALAKPPYFITPEGPLTRAGRRLLRLRLACRRLSREPSA